MPHTSLFARLKPSRYVPAFALRPRAAPEAAHRVIIDTDFALPPQDDGLALALNSPELYIAGITTVAGNFNLARANADVLRMLEITYHESIPVHAGARRPLVHVKDDFAVRNYGKWWSDDPPPSTLFSRYFLLCSPLLLCFSV